MIVVANPWAAILLRVPGYSATMTCANAQDVACPDGKELSIHTAWCLEPEPSCAGALFGALTIRRQFQDLGNN
jgi:hypothetical protein